MLAPMPLTTLPGAETTPALSPDGTRVAFAWDGGPQGQQKGLDRYVKAVGSEKVVRVTNHPSSWITPVWSPYGSQIAFHRLAGDGKGIYVVPAMGGPEKRLLATHLRNRMAAQISWSADGKWIGFADSVRDTELTRAYLLNVETLQAVEIAHNPDCLNELTPTFSHRDEKLAYLCIKNTNDLALYLFKGLGGTPKKFAQFRNTPSGFAWTSDDQRIVMATTT
jgi:Tol biopolymer transport system component